MSTLTEIGVLLAIPEPYGSELRDRRAAYGDPQADTVPMHVTLLPPTEVKAGSLPAIEKHLAAVAEHGRPFRMRLCGTGTFRPVSQVVFVRVEVGVAQCVSLEAQVRAGVLDRELQFPYHPHVTVAHDLDQSVLDAAQADLAGYGADFEISGFGLYHREPDGSWTILRTFAFPAGIRQTRPHPTHTGQVGSGGMKLSRRGSWLLVVFALWSWTIWVTLIKNIANDPRSWGPDNGGPTAFLTVHVVLAVVSIACGTAIGWLGLRGLRAAKQQVAGDSARDDSATTAKDRLPV